MFTYRKKDVHLSILVNVDDLIIASNTSKGIFELKAYLGRYFYMKNLGALRYFLGIEVSQKYIGRYLGAYQEFICARENMH